jgi:ribonucleotide monophosphatase NagD (HAD superfamily)
MFIHSWFVLRSTDIYSMLTLHTLHQTHYQYTHCETSTTTAVIVGFDRHINYYKIQYAQLCINENKGCEFIATNLDAVTHLTDAQEWAGNGSMVGAIKVCFLFFCFLLSLKFLA